jgi:transposase, IS30 family
MRRRRWRGHLSPADQEELWRRWRQGESLRAIARALDRRRKVVHRILVGTGGFTPVPRRRSPRVLSVAEREEISRGVAAGHSLRQIAARLGRAPSTVGRELGRHGGRACYRAASADAAAWQLARRPKVCKLAAVPRLRMLVAEKLRQDWSPEQIAGWLRHTFPEDERVHVSHETIYRSLFIQARGGLKRELLQHLRSQRTLRRARTATRTGQHRGQIVDAVSIRDRPAEVADRAVPGHWEGDLLAGAHHSHIATLVERQSRFTLLVKVAGGGKDTASVVPALARQMRTLPTALRRSLTWDRGLELAQHAAFTVATDVQVYFCDPQSPWQRGTNENTNRLLRQYLPKGTDLTVHSQAARNRIAQRLNTRPRKTLAYRTPADIFASAVAMTG